MRLKIVIKAPICDGVRDIEISTYNEAGQRSQMFRTEAISYEDQYLARGYYACGFVDGFLNSLGFSSELEKQCMKDLMRLHVGKSIVLEYEKQHCSVNII